MLMTSRPCRATGAAWGGAGDAKACDGEASTRGSGSGGWDREPSGAGGGKAAGAAMVDDEGSKEEVGRRGLAVEAARGSGVEGSSSPCPDTRVVRVAAVDRNERERWGSSGGFAAPRL